MRLVKIGWIPALAAVLSIALTLALGNWQMRRAGQKQSLQQALQLAAAKSPLAPASWQDPGALVHQRLTVTGRWLPEAVIYLDNRPHQGRSGLYVLMPLKIDAASGHPEVILMVNRGWLPRDPAQQSRIAAYATPAGKIKIQGIALQDEPRFMELGPASEPLGGIWQNFDFATYESASRLSLVPLVLRQDNPLHQSTNDAATIDGSTNDGLIRDWPDQGSTMQAQIDRHHGYAAQWFGLSALIAFLTLFYGYRNARKPDSAVQ